MRLSPLVDRRLNSCTITDHKGVSMTSTATGLSRRNLLRLAGLASGAVAFGGLSACATGGSSEGSDAFEGEIAVAHLQAIIGGAPFLIADQLGYFREEGLEPELVSFPGGTDTVRGIASGIQFGMPATLPALIAQQKGQSNLRLIGGAINTATVVFLVAPDSDITSIEDLRGKKIAVSVPGSITTYFANRIVTEQGLAPDKDVQILSVGGPPDCWTALQQGVVDVAWSSAPLSNSLTASGSARVLFETREYVQHWVDNTYWTTQDVIDDAPEVIEMIMRSLAKAVDLIKNDLDKAAPAYAKGAGLEDPVARDALEQYAPAMGFEIDMAGIEENVKAGAELGQLDPDAVDLDVIVVPDFANKL
jgi:NitT/TauT family transport system substrate-binding protein